MKKILFLILFLPLFSCNDWIDVDSEVSVTYRNYFNSEQELEDLFNTILGAEKATLAYPALTSLDWSGLPCSYAGKDSEPFRLLSPSVFWDDSKKTGGWGNYYKAIFMANFIRENEFRFNNISEERMKYWFAQADFAKGLMYFRIAQDWGEAIVAPGTEDASELAKSPVDSILAQAIRSAEAALILPTHDKLTDSQGKNISSRQYASLGTVHTLLANIYAWMGGLYNNDEYWKKAEEEASLVIDGKVGFYDLVSMKDLVEKTFGKARDVTEVIFAIEKNEQDDEWLNMAGLEMPYPGFALINYPYAETDPRKVDKAQDVARIHVDSVKKLYSEKDLRRKEYWYKLGETIPMDTINAETHMVDRFEFEPTYAYINKWRDKVYSTNPEVIESSKSVLITMECNRVYWRLADLILLRAECRAHLGDGNAVKDLNRIRERAGLGAYTGSTEKKELLKEIFRERERELFGEGQRYHDIVRNGYFREVLLGNYKTLTDKDVKNGALYLPVANNAFLNNPLMTQNIYWLWHQN